MHTPGLHFSLIDADGTPEVEARMCPSIDWKLDLLGTLFDRWGAEGNLDKMTTSLKNEFANMLYYWEDITCPFMSCLIRTFKYSSSVKCGEIVR